MAVRGKGVGAVVVAVVEVGDARPSPAHKGWAWILGDRTLLMIDDLGDEGAAGEDHLTTRLGALSMCCSQRFVITLERWLFCVLVSPELSWSRQEVKISCTLLSASISSM